MNLVISCVCVNQASKLFSYRRIIRAPSFTQVGDLGLLQMLLAQYLQPWQWHITFILQHSFPQMDHSELMVCKVLLPFLLNGNTCLGITKWLLRVKEETWYIAISKFKCYKYGLQWQISNTCIIFRFFLNYKKWKLYCSFIDMKWNIYSYSPNWCFKKYVLLKLL